MNCWILQCNINHYCWFDSMKEHKNDPDTWGINKFIGEIEKGDTVFIWLTKYIGKETRGIYAMAEITGLPNKHRKNFDWEQKYWRDQKAKARRKRLINLELQYTKFIIDNYISKHKLEAAGLENLLILRMPRATIYKVTRECEAIKKLVGTRQV